MFYGVSVMKKLLALCLCFVFLFCLCGCASNDENIKADDKPVVLNPEEVIKVNLDVSLYENLICQKFEFSLSEAQKLDNFITLTKNDDGNAVFTIKRKDYNSFKKALLDSRKDIFEGYNEAAAENNIVRVEYNADITSITVYVDKNVYNPEIKINPEYLKAYNCISGCGRNATLYHMYYLEKIEKCTVTVKDEKSGEIIETQTYPNIIKESLK